MKKSKLYTRTGDAGLTSLIGGVRVAKNSPRLEAYGTVDELNSHIGLVNARTTDPDIRAMLTWIQHRLFDIGSCLACDPDSDFAMPAGIDEEAILRLEHAIDAIDSRVPSVNRFVLPGGSVESAETHIARTVARRAERRILTLAGQSEVPSEIIRFINRLSDYLFVLARFNNVNQNVDEIFWQKDC